MASFVTNRGKYVFGRYVLRRDGGPTTKFKAVLITAASTPTVDTNTFADLANEIANGQGYTTGGMDITIDATGFPTLTEDDTNDRADFTVMTMTWTATGGTLPASGSARWLVITDDNATLNSREVYIVIDLGGTKVAAEGQAISVSGFKLRYA